MPFLGESMTITGSGFSTVLAENQVELASCGGQCTPTSFPMVVTAASTTQLTVDIPWNYPIGFRPQRGRLRVVVNGDSTIATDTTLFAWQPEVLDIHNYDYPGAPNYAVRGGDYIQLNVYGMPVNGVGGSLLVNATPVVIDSVRTAGSLPGPNFGLEQLASLWFRLPTEVYSAGYLPIDPGSDTAYVDLTFSARGRSGSRHMVAWRYPRYVYGGVGGIYPAGAMQTFQVDGSNMPGPFTILYSSLDPSLPSGTQSASTCSPICDSFQFGLPALPPGDYLVVARLDAFQGTPVHPLGGVTLQ